MDYFKLGVGPMSREIIDLIDRYSEKSPMMVVASRNQVDYNSGYVCTTSELVRKFSNRSQILICRDHCGPYFKDTDKVLKLKEAIAECKKTIDADIYSGFDLIHIDVSRVPKKQLEVAKELIEYTLEKDKKVWLEFGSENNTGEDLPLSRKKLEEQLSFAAQYKPNVKFFVTQTGSFTQHTQVGKFDVEENKKLVEKVHSFGLKFKEHNADYLVAVDIQKRKEAGVDAMNIAPQLGVIQTRVLFEMSKETSEWKEFADMVYKEELWKKWMPDTENSKELAVLLAGHYHYNTKQYLKLVEKISKEDFHIQLKKRIFEVFDTYLEQKNEMAKR